MSNDTKWTKRAIYDALEGQISQASIVKRDGEWVVKGKYCIISPHEDSSWDIWICAPDDMRNCLSKRRFKYRCSILEKYAGEGSLTVLDGEAWVTVPTIEFLVKNPFLCRKLGLKRKRRISGSLKEALTKRLLSTRRPEPA